MQGRGEDEGRDFEQERHHDTRFNHAGSDTLRTTRGIPIRPQRLIAQWHDLRYGHSEAGETYLLEIRPRVSLEQPNMEILVHHEVEPEVLEASRERREHGKLASERL